MVEGAHLILDPVLLVNKGSPQQGLPLLVGLLRSITFIHRYCLSKEDWRIYILNHFKGSLQKRLGRGVCRLNPKTWVNEPISCWFWLIAETIARCFFGGSPLLTSSFAADVANQLKLFKTAGSCAL